MAKPRHPLLLMILDGWGVGQGGPHDAIAQAHCAHMTRLKAEHAYTTLEAGGEAVGLPPKQMGNSEVGHLNIGAGRVVPQDFVRINRAVANNELGANPVLKAAFQNAKGKRLHLLGLLGPGGVHSHQDHLLGLLKAAKAAGLTDVAIHHLLDGRDTPPQSALAFASAIENAIAKIGVGRVASVAGRYWTMDRDNRWERTKKGYDLLIDGVGPRAPSAADAIENAYAHDVTDEFIEPTLIDPDGLIRDKDVVICYNFRPDRMRQFVRMLADAKFKAVARTPVACHVVTMTLYDATFADLGVQIAFAPEHPRMTMGEVYAKAGLRQLRIAETEKYAHVTYFFNGGVEAALPGEERLLIPSPKVATYDLQPEMSAPAITKALEERVGSGYALVVLNFANADMVGHTGDLEATIKAVQILDEQIGRLVAAYTAQGYAVAITADHGNAEKMMDDDGHPQTAHTDSPVPFYVILPKGSPRVALRSGGALANVAPTLLDLLGLEKPAAMKGESLLERGH
jgi:2,3-bisphosphoglycerate-independent phosphoglycerate mutase